MKYSVSWAFMTIAMAAPCFAKADDAAPNPDNKVAVTQRIPQGYEPLGWRFGSFNVWPSLDVDAATNDNVFYRPANQVSDAILSVAPSVVVNSDWTRNALTATLSANYDDYSKYSSLNALSWDAGAAGRLDVGGNDNVSGGASYSQNYEPLFDPGTPRTNSPATTAAEPVKYDVAMATLGFNATGARIKYSGTVNYANYNYFDVRSVSGGILAQGSRNYNSTDVDGHVEYYVSPAASIYLDYDANSRSYALSDLGRNSHGYTVNAGSSFDITKLMRGNVQLGYLDQSYNNHTFKDASGTFVSGEVQYFLTELLTLTLKRSESVQETPDVGVAGYVSAGTTFKVDYELLRTFVISGSYGAIANKYDGEDRHDNVTNFDLNAKYRVSRNIILKAEYNYFDNQSRGTLAVPSYKANTFKMFLTLQY